MAEGIYPGSLHPSPKHEYRTKRNRPVVKRLSLSCGWSEMTIVEHICQAFVSCALCDISLKRRHVTIECIVLS